MKRALAIAVAVCTLGVAGFSQIGPITGSWTAKYCFIGTPVLSSTLVLNYTVAGWTITSTSTFASTGLTGQTFKLAGAFGPLTIAGNMTFNVTAVVYEKSDLTTSFDFGGLAISAKVEHWGLPYIPAGICTGATTGVLRYTLTTVIAPVTVKAIFFDCCTGTAFDNLNIKLVGVGLCCGVTYDVELDFDKGGFDYIKFSVKNIAAFCCGISFNASIQFTAQTKTVTITPKFAGLGDACLAIYAGPVMTGTTVWHGIELYGWKLRCTLGDCNYIEFVTALNISEVEKVLGDIFLGSPCNEYEYLGLGFCGAGCCGGKYTVDLKIFFGTTGGLFDMSRFVGVVKIPIMTNFTLNLDFTMPVDAACVAAQFCLGWTFTF